MAHDVFISYSSKDKAVADAATAVLEGRGARCWVAPRDILPGADWGEAIIDAIAGSRVMVLVFSANANASPQVKREVERAVNKGVIVVPFRIENVPLCKTLEYFVSTPHWMDAYSGPLDQHLSRLAHTVLALVNVPQPGGVASSALREVAPATTAVGAAHAGRRSALPRVGAAGVVVAAAAAGVIGMRAWISEVPRASRADVPSELVAPRPPADGTPATREIAPKRVEQAPAPAASQPSTGRAAPAVPATPAPAAATSADEVDRRRAAAAAAEARALRVRSITVVGKQATCVINARRLAEGDTVDDFRVERITAEQVVVEKGGFRFLLRPRVEADTPLPVAPPPSQWAAEAGGDPPPGRSRRDGPTVWGESSGFGGSPPSRPPHHPPPRGPRRGGPR